MDRRGFIAAAASAVAIPASAAEPAAGRKIVTVGGRRARVIDVHAHCAFRDVEALVDGTPLQRKNFPNLAFGPQRIAEMDRRGIDVQVLSVNIFWWYAADMALADRIVSAHDQALAKLCAAYPGRLAPLSSVALQFPELAARQLENAVRNLGFCGAAIGGHIAGEPLSNPRFDPFWAKCEALNVPVFMHPDGASDLVREGAWRGRGNLNNVVGNPLETTVFLSRMISEGVFDRFPRLQLCAAHAGGYLPSYLGRSEVACTSLGGANCANAKPPSAYLRNQILVDCMVFSDEGLRHLVAEMGAGRVVYGTDLPYPWPDMIDTIVGSRILTDSQKRDILGGNLARLLRI